MTSISLADRLRQRLADRATWLLVSAAALTALLAVSVWQAAPVAANSHTDSLRAGVCLESPPDFSGSSSQAAGQCTDGSGNNLQSVIKTALNILTWITGVAAVFVLIIAGFRYVVSGGSSSGVTGAKNMIIYALIGVVIALLAQVIVRFVIGNVDDAVTNTNSSSTADGTCTNNGGVVTCESNDGSPVPAGEHCTVTVDGESCEYTL